MWTWRYCEVAGKYMWGCWRKSLGTQYVWVPYSSVLYPTKVGWQNMQRLAK